jgi:hypothetical protein
MSAAVAGTTLRPTPTYTTLRDVTGVPMGQFNQAMPIAVYEYPASRASPASAPEMREQT